LKKKRTAANRSRRTREGSPSARVVRETLQTLAADPRMIEELLLTAGLLGVGAPIRVSSGALTRAILAGGELAQANPRVGAAMLVTAAAIAHEHGLSRSLGEDAITLAARADRGRTAWLLGELATWPAAGWLGERARSALEALAALGAGPRRSPFRARPRPASCRRPTAPGTARWSCASAARRRRPSRSCCSGRTAWA
jgi:hypothetical protein